MSALIEGMLAQTADKSDEDMVEVRAGDLKVMCSQATARGQMIVIYEELLAYSAEHLTTGQPDLDLARTILRAISTGRK